MSVLPWMICHIYHDSCNILTFGLNFTINICMGMIVFALWRRCTKFGTSENMIWFESGQFIFYILWFSNDYREYFWVISFLFRNVFLLSLSYIDLDFCILLYPTQRVVEGIMFLTHPSVSQSVSQSVSPVFLVSATPLKPLNRISWNFVVMKDIMCRCAYPQEILIQLFFSDLRPFWT